jgi:integrase
MRTFNRLVDARHWASETEAALTAGRRVPNAEELRRSLGDLIDRYIEETLPLRAHKDVVNPPRQLGWWKDRIGDVPLIDLDGDVIGKGLLELSKGNTLEPFRRAREVAGLEDFRFHDLRHTAASYLLMQGATLGELSEVLGHKTLQMVKRYAHLSDLHTESVLRRLAAKISGE